MSFEKIKPVGNENRLPGDVPVCCLEEDCKWEGILQDCPIIRDSDGWEQPKYDVAICPICGEPVDGI